MSRNLLLGVTGSVAAIKTNELVGSLSQITDQAKIVVTETALKFIYSVKNGHLTTSRFELYQDADQWGQCGWKKRGDSVLHIDLMKWADILLIAPLSANTLAKWANGLCDNLLTSIIRSWPTSYDYEFDNYCYEKPIIIAPAMHTNMWNSGVTQEQLEKLYNHGFKKQIIGPIEKQLACGDIGDGAMAEVSDIVSFIENVFDNIQTTK